MKRVVLLWLSFALLLPAAVGAEDAEAEEAWLLQLRGSGMYKEGLEAVHSKIDAAYDLGAEHEPVCAKASRAWADAAIERLRKRVEAHGLPAGKKAD